MRSIIPLVTVGLLTSSITASAIRRDALDYGSCTNPVINWSRDKGFYPDNTRDFPHGAAEDFSTIADFICSELRNKCKCSQDTYTACIGASRAAGPMFHGTKGQAQTEVFKYYLLHREAPKPSPTTTPATPKPTAGTTADVAIKFSKSYVEFDGHIDPKWWFDNKITTGDSWICDINSPRMPGGFYLSFGCDGADETSMPLMRALLNAMVDATVDNTTASDNERIFKHGIEKKQHCSRVGCKTDERKYTRFPREVRLGVRDRADGKGFLQGSLHYTISKSTSEDCGLCAAFVHGGEGTAAVASVAQAFAKTASKLSPVISLMTAAIDIGCFAVCG